MLAVVTVPGSGYYIPTPATSGWMSLTPTRPLATLAVVANRSPMMGSTFHLPTLDSRTSFAPRSWRTSLPQRRVTQLAALLLFSASAFLSALQLGSLVDRWGSDYDPVRHIRIARRL